MVLYGLLVLVCCPRALLLAQDLEKDPKTENSFLIPSLFQVPIKLIGEWTPAFLSDLHCPPIYPIPNNDDNFPEDLEFTMQSTHHELSPVDGNLCYGLEYSTECSENFFGGKSIAKRIDRIPITDLECRDTISKKDNGLYLDPYFPAEECLWYDTKLISKRFIMVQRYQVLFDPYYMGFVDGLFLNRLCKELVCRTVHENSLWIGTHSVNSTCSPFLQHKGNFFVNRLGQPTFVKYSPNQIESTHGACTMSYCGHNGLRLLSGVFLGAYTGKYSFPSCQTGSLISVRNSNSNLMNLKDQFQELESRLECLTALQNILTTKKVSFLELSRLHPKYQGRHYIFRIQNQKLMKVMAIWKPLKEFLLKGRIDVGILSDGSVFTWTDWVDSGLTNLESGFGGVHRLNNKTLIIPDLELRKMIYAESVLASHDLEPVNHPDITQRTREGLTGHLKELRSNHQINPDRWFSGVWINLEGKIFLISMGLITIGGFIVLIRSRSSIITFIRVIFCHRRGPSAETRAHVNEISSVESNRFHEPSSLGVSKLDGDSEITPGQFVKVVSTPEQIVKYSSSTPSEQRYLFDKYAWK